MANEVIQILLIEDNTADRSIPGATMIGYAGAYLIVALGIAICHFNGRDLGGLLAHHDN